MNLQPVDFDHTENIDIYAAQKEVGLIHMFEPEPGIFIAESPNVIKRALETGYKPMSAFIYERMRSDPLLKELGDIPIYYAPEMDAREFLGFKLTSGILVAMRRKAPADYKEVLRGAKRILVMEGVVNPTNVGAMFRSAAALGIDAVLLSPACSDPLYRRAIRVSVGNVFLMPWAFIGFNEADWRANGLRLLHDEGFTTAALALRSDNVNINDPKLKQTERLALIVGAEGDGLCDETINGADMVVKVPMTRGVDSLNVATAAAIAFWEIGCKKA